MTSISLDSFWKIEDNPKELSSSNAAEGSSKKRILVDLIKARAIANRCLCPPESESISLFTNSSQDSPVYGR